MHEILKYEYKYQPRHIPFMKEQIWEAKQDISIYSEVGYHEFTQIGQFIDTNLQTVIEVGCGLGRGSIFLNNILKNDNVKYIMADRTGYTQNTGDFNPTNDEFYNDLVLTKDFCELNGINNVSTFDTEIDDWEQLPRADLIFSLCSFGMHVSIDRYMERLLSVAKPTSTMIFGIRNANGTSGTGGNYTTQSFDTLFEEVLLIKGQYIPHLPYEDWLILRHPIQ